MVLERSGVKDDGISDRMVSYLVKSRADSTTAKYSATFKRFEKFCIENSYKHSPANPIHVAVYLTNLLDKKVSYGVISSVVYAIKWIHSINNFTDPTENGFVKNLLETAKRLRSQPVRRKDTISTEHLISLCDKYTSSDDLIDIRDLTMILLGFAGFLRFDEINNLMFKDIHFEEEHIEINIRKSKTDQFRSGNKVFIAKGATSACAYTMLRRYVTKCGKETMSDSYLFKPLFKSKGKCNLIHKNKKLSYTRTRECILNKLKMVAPELNLGTHSLRASGITTVANKDSVNERCLMRHGRWKTETSKNMYVEDSIAKKLKVTQELNL